MRGGGCRQRPTVYKGRDIYIFHFRLHSPKCFKCTKPIAPAAGEKEAMRIIAMDKSFCLSCFTCKVNNLLLHPYTYNFIFRNAMRTCLDRKLGVAIRSMTTSFVNNAPCRQLANSSQRDNGLRYYIIFA